MKKVLSKDGTPIAYERTGQGTALILVDGAMSSRAFGPGVALAPLLAQTLPQAQYRTVEGRTHDVAPEVIAAALIEFFAGDKTKEHGQDQKDPQRIP